MSGTPKVALVRTTETKMGSPHGLAEGGGGPVVVAGVTPCQGVRESRTQGKGGQVTGHHENLRGMRNAKTPTRCWVSCVNAEGVQDSQPRHPRSSHWRARCEETPHAGFGGGPTGKGPAMLVPRLTAYPASFAAVMSGTSQPLDVGCPGLCCACTYSACPGAAGSRVSVSVVRPSGECFATRTTSRSTSRVDPPRFTT